MRRAHHLSSTSPLDGGHALLCPPYEATHRELICLACKRNLDARLRQTGTTGKSPESCPAPFAKIFCFRSHANHRHNSARLTADEGRWPSSRTRGEMRWTREPRLTCAARAYGEVVWFGRRGAGAKLRGKYFAGNGGKRAVLRGEHEVSRKAIAQGRPECSRCPVCSCAICLRKSHARPRVQQAPGLPCALCFEEGKRRCKPRATSAARGEGMSTVIASEAKQSTSRHKKRMDCFASLAMTLRGRNVPDRPSSTVAGGARGCILRCSRSLSRRRTLLTGNGNSAGLSVLVQLACKLRNPRHAPEK